MNFLLAWAVSLVYVGTKSWQQKNVQYDLYWSIPPGSYIMGYCEVFITGLVVRSLHDIWELNLLAFCIGTGAWMGSMLGMWIHAKRRK